MSTHPYIPLYVDDYDAHTSHLSPAEDGVYGRLLRLAWRTPGCSLPNDPAWLARKLRLSADEFGAIAQPVIDEFFKVLRGRLVQGRLKAEYDDISRKKTARRVAGKKGGEAKALKEQGKSSSNATVLLGDTRAFPDPDPEPLVEAIASPSPVAGKVARRKPETAIPDGYPDDQAIAAEQTKARAAGVNLDARVAAERFRNHAQQVDRRARDWAAAWRNWMLSEVGKAPKAPGASASTLALPLAVWSGPPELRAWVVAATDEGFAASYLDHCQWRQADRLLVARNSFHAEKIRIDCAAVLRRAKVGVVTAADLAREPHIAGAAA